MFTKKEISEIKKNSIKEAVHFTNLQPMEGLENISKGKKIIVQY